MRRIVAIACTAMVMTALHGQDSATLPAPAGAASDERAGAKARLRFAGVFIAGFRVHRVAGASCESRVDPRPWFALDCGLWRCPKTVLLGMPAPPSYSNWQKSPRVREIEVDAGVPLIFKLAGSYNEAVEVNVTGISKISVSPCDYNVAFTPEAGKMYEASLDAEARSCVLSMTEIVRPLGFWEKVPLESAVKVDCRVSPEISHRP